MRNLSVRLGVLVSGTHPGSNVVRALGQAIRRSVQEPFRASARLSHVDIELADVCALPTLPAVDLLQPPLTLRRANAWLSDAANGIRIEQQPLRQWRVTNAIDAILITVPLKARSGARSILGAAHLPQWNRGKPSFSRVALVDDCAATDRSAAAHELGHLLGLQHAAEWQSVEYINDIAQLTARKSRVKHARTAARGWQCPELRLQTIMGDLQVEGDDGYTTVPVWSEPGIDWFGNRTTDIGTRARGCANLADEVSYLREVLPQFVAWRR